MALLDNLANALVPGLADVKAQAAAGADQLSLAFEVLIVEGAIACGLLAVLVVLELKRRRG